MAEKSTRRKFLHMMGIAPLSVVSVAGGAEASIPSQKSEKLLHWTCECGEQVYTQRPTEVGESVKVTCPEHHEFAVTWQGTHYSYRRIEGGTPISSATHVPV